MPHIPIPRSASQVIKNFRTRQLEGLTNHLRLFGPLPTTSEAVVSLTSSESESSTPVEEPGIVLPNPFIARKNPKTGKWRGPKYSLRRQADLVKKAKETDKLTLIPPGLKFFAMELRMKRLRASLSPADSAILAEAQTMFNKPGTKPNTKKENSSTSRDEAESDKSEKELQGSESQPRFSTFETALHERQDELAVLEEELGQSQSQQELDALAAFEKSESEADLRERRKRAADYSGLEDRISKARLEVVKAGQRLEKAKEDHEMAKVEQAQERLWSNPFWVGDVKKKVINGEELGVKLYAGKKRMFKGHNWEKERVKRRRRQNLLMRDMKARIARYKSVSCIRRYCSIGLAYISAVLQEEETESSQTDAVVETSQATFLVITITYQYRSRPCSRHGHGHLDRNP